jgi:hypothetical protein
MDNFSLSDVSPSALKSSVQWYEETCHRMNICPCSIIIRDIWTAELNLKNYGLGARGCIPLAVALSVEISISLLHERHHMKTFCLSLA